MKRMAVVADSRKPPKQAIHAFMVGWLMLGVFSVAGCQRRAYTDLYVERMAGEIRELEDRIYEYDAAYRATEDELAIIQSENEHLKDRLAAAERKSLFGPSGGNKSESIKPAPGASGATKIPPSSSGTSSSKDSTIIPVPDPNADIDLESPGPVPKKAIPPATPGGANKSTILPPGASDGPTPEALNRLPPKTGSGSLKAIDPKDLEPPEIEMGTLAVPPVQSSVPSTNKPNTPFPSLPTFPPPVKGADPTNPDSKPGNLKSTESSDGFLPAPPAKSVLPPSASRNRIPKDSQVVTSDYSQVVDEKETAHLPARSTTET